MRQIVPPAYEKVVSASCVLLGRKGGGDRKHIVGFQGAPPAVLEPQNDPRGQWECPAGRRWRADGSAEPQGWEEHSKEAPSGLRGDCSPPQGTGSNRAWQEMRLVPGAEQVFPAARASVCPELPSAPVPPPVPLPLLTVALRAWGWGQTLYLRLSLHMKSSECLARILLQTICALRPLLRATRWRPGAPATDWV